MACPHCHKDAPDESLCEDCWEEQRLDSEEAKADVEYEQQREEKIFAHP